MHVALSTCVGSHVMLVKNTRCRSANTQAQKQVTAATTAKHTLIACNKMFML